MKPQASVEDVVILVSSADLALKLLALLAVVAGSLARFGWLDGGLIAAIVFLLAPYPPRIHTKAGGAK